MKITRVTPILTDRYLFVRIETDAGIHGIGESGAWGHLEASAAAIAKFGDYLVGRDPAPIEHHWQVMHRFAYFRGAATGGAISAIDIALWDIKGKTLGVPVHALLGGPVRTRVRAYAHVKAPTIALMEERCLIMQQRGFTAIGHLNPFLDEDRDQAYGRGHARKIREAADNVARLRAALGQDMDLCVELHRRLTPAEAVVFAEAIAPQHPFFIEDPIRPDSVDSMAAVAARTTVPVATGERFFSPYEFQSLLARGGVAFARVSVCVCGGITGARRVAAIAEVHDVQVVPHNPLSPVSLAACLQLAAAVPNIAIQEYPTSGLGWNSDDGMDLRGTELVDSVPDCTAGSIEIPTAPGLGMDLLMDAVAAHPPLPRRVAMRPHADGFVVDQ
jgi:galactonate dehydratase